MAFTHTVNDTLVVESSSFTASRNYTGTNRVSIAETVAVGTNTLINVAIDVSAVKSFRMQSDVAMTVKTNSSGSPDDTITLVAGIPYVWTTDSYDAFLLGTDVTKVYVTNVAEAAFKIEVIQDSTP
jgi:hypothetical protein